MSATIIRTQEAVAGAPMADLVATYQALTGKAVKKFESRTVAERRVIDAIMASKDATGHLGVPQHATPGVTTVEERVDLAEKKGKNPEEQMPKADDPAPEGVEVDDSVNPFPPATLAHQLWVASRAATKIEPRPRAVAPRDPDAPKRSAVVAVRATFAGRTKPQAGSIRNNVLLYVQGRPSKCATVEEIAAHIDESPRGYVQKLIETGHFVAITVEEAAAAASTEEAAA